MNNVEKVSETEKNNSSLALEVAREGIVLLENNGALPLRSKKIALFGTGARRTSKGGTGSGDVNNRNNVSVEQGLRLCGFEITTTDWIDDYEKRLVKDAEERDAKIRQLGKKYSILRLGDLMNAIACPITFSGGREITAEDVKASDTDVAVYVVTRQAGEGMDRRDVKGEYRLLDKETEDVEFLAKHYKDLIIVINTGACVDVKPILALKPGAVVYMGQSGQNGGLALAQLMKGEYPFSGKLAASWPEKLSDLPCFDSFSYLDGNTDRELYKDGIYVGYRYYDSFNVKPLYEFGYGISYTTFSIKAEAEVSGTVVTVNATV